MKNIVGQYGMKDDSPFRHRLAGCKPTLTIGLRFWGHRR